MQPTAHFYEPLLLRGPGGAAAPDVAPLALAAPGANGPAYWSYENWERRERDRLAREWRRPWGTGANPWVPGGYRRGDYGAPAYGRPAAGGACAAWSWAPRDARAGGSAEMYLGADEFALAGGSAEMYPKAVAGGAARRTRRAKTAKKAKTTRPRRR